MKKIALLILSLFMMTNLTAQDKPVKIVFDVTSSNEKVHGAAVRHVKAMAKAYPESKFEVVMYSGAINMVLIEKSTVAFDMEALTKNKNVSFVVCEGTMKRHKIKKSQLIPGVTTVPDGILEIIERQAEGWGYIKESQ